jgi:hypothetical protein
VTGGVVVGGTGGGAERGVRHSGPEIFKAPMALLRSWPGILRMP